MTTHEARTAKIASALRSAPLGTWAPVKVACLGTVYVHRMPLDAANLLMLNELWVRLGSPMLAESTDEFRGTAEEVAKSLALRLRAPSKAVAQAIEIINRNADRLNPGGEMGMTSMRAPEVAAWLGLDEEVTYRAIAHLEECGYGKEGGEYGWSYAA